MGVDCLIKSDQDVLYKERDVNVKHMTGYNSWESMMGEEDEENLKKPITLFSGV